MFETAFRSFWMARISVSQLSNTIRFIGATSDKGAVACALVSGSLPSLITA